jgi:hypothetical protein
MSKRFRMNCKHLLMGVACGLGMLVLTSGQATAGTLEIVITDGTTVYDILDDGPLDSLIGPNAIQALASALVFPDFKIIGLNASTNNPGDNDPVGANLTVGAEVQRITGGGPATLTITVTDEDYTLPAGAKVLGSTAGAVFTGVPAGDSSKFTSWFNANNAGLAKSPPPSGPLMFTSTGLTHNGSSASTGNIPVGSAGTYGLTNETVITMSGAPTGPSIASVPDVVIGGSTQVLGTAVPEPASLAIMLPALPVVIMGWFRHRKARATS